MLATVAWKSRPIAGSAMPTTVASSAAMPDPRTVAASTQRPLLLAYRKPGVVSATAPPVTSLALAVHCGGPRPATLAQVVSDLAAEPPRVPPVEQRTGNRAGEQRGERERRPADAGGQPPGELPGQR